MSHSGNEESRVGHGKEMPMSHFDDEESRLGHGEEMPLCQ